VAKITGKFQKFKDKEKTGRARLSPKNK